jgi:sec-independent protein translocase protein TatA
MPALGPAEILVVLVVALLVFGPNRLPDMARQAGRAMREFRRVQGDLRAELRDTVGSLDPLRGGDPVPSLPPRDPATPQDAEVRTTDDAVSGSAGNPAGAAADDSAEGSGPPTGSTETA